MQLFFHLVNYWGKLVQRVCDQNKRSIDTPESFLIHVQLPESRGVLQKANVVSLFLWGRDVLPQRHASCAQPLYA